MTCIKLTEATLVLYWRHSENVFFARLLPCESWKIDLIKLLTECPQLGFVTLNGNLAVSGWVGLGYDC